MRLVRLFALAGLLATPAVAASPYMASADDSECRNRKSCTLTFPAATTMLTIQHVSCGFVTKGESGGGILTVLSTAGTPSSTPGDRLPPGEFGASGNILNTAIETTLFYVAANDKPTITFTSTAPILNSDNGGCLISGTSS